MHLPQTQCRSVAAEKLRPNSGRKPLQPRNSPATPVSCLPKSKPKGDLIEVYSAIESNKENLIFASPIASAPTKVEPLLDSSLAEELSAVRKKLERLRSDRDKTEQMLRERDLFLEEQMKEVEKRGEVQKTLEIEVDRLYRLKQLHLSCTERNQLPILCSDYCTFQDSLLLTDRKNFYFCPSFRESESVSDPVIEGEAATQENHRIGADLVYILTGIEIGANGGVGGRDSRRRQSLFNFFRIT